MKIDTIIGVGNIGSNISSKFKILGIFKNCYTINDNDGDFKVPTLKTHEEYDSLEMNFDLKNIGNEILFIVCGSENISGISLKFLELLKDRKIHILYYCQNIQFLQKFQILQHNVTFGILQEFARSGLFQSFNILEEMLILKMLKDVNLFNFEDKVSDFIVNSLSSIFRNYEQKNSIGRTPEFSEHYRIGTFGILNIETLEEFKFFTGLEGKLEKHYFYVIPENSEDGVNILTKVGNIIQKKSEDGNVVTFSIHSTSHNVEYCYILFRTSEIQRIQK